MLGYAVRVKLLDENVAKLVPNPEPKRREVLAFASLEDVEVVGAELGPAFSALPVVAALTGLRPEDGSRSSGAMSTARPACSTSTACSPTGR